MHGLVPAGQAMPGPMLGELVEHVGVDTQQREVRLGRAGEALHRGVALHPQERLQGVHPPLPVTKEATQPILLRFAVAAALRLDCTASCGFCATTRSHAANASTSSTTRTTTLTRTAPRRSRSSRRYSATTTRSRSST